MFTADLRLHFTYLLHSRFVTVVALCNNFNFYHSDRRGHVIRSYLHSYTYSLQYHLATTAYPCYKDSLGLSTGTLLRNLRDLHKKGEKLKIEHSFYNNSDI